jgi:hypothetical protein
MATAIDALVVYPYLLLRDDQPAPSHPRQWQPPIALD